MTRPTVLIADDDSQMRQAVRTRLSATGYDVIECCDGLEAITKSRARRVDALILDQEMPLGEGRTIAKGIRQYTDAPIIFLSGHDREEFRETVMRLPDTYYLGKPLDDGKLDALLGSLVGTDAFADR